MSITNPRRGRSTVAPRRRLRPTHQHANPIRQRRADCQRSAVGPVSRGLASDFDVERLLAREG